MSSFVDAIAGSLAWPAAVSSSTGAFHDGAATAAVVKVQVCIAASALPAVSLTAVDAEALWIVPLGSGAAGRKPATGPLVLTLPATATPPTLTVKVDAVKVVASMASENVTAMRVEVATALALLAGEVA